MQHFFNTRNNSVPQNDPSFFMFFALHTGRMRGSVTHFLTDPGEHVSQGPSKNVSQNPHPPCVSNADSSVLKEPLTGHDIMTQ